MEENKYRSMTGWFVWIIAALFYSYEFFIRISPAAMVSHLMKSFAVDAATLGTISALYYYAYAAMQIPVGILFDRYGVQKLLTVAALMVTIGSILFATTNNLLLAEIGRVIMGAGSAFSFVGCIKLAVNWFALRRLAIIVGLTNFMGVFGATFAEAPLSYAVDQIGWRQAMLWVGIAGAFIALLISLIVKDKPRSRDKQKRAEEIAYDELHKQKMFEGLKLILKSKQAWLVSIFGCLMVAPISAFAELWANPFLVSYEHLRQVEAAGLSTFIYIGISIGGPMLGWISGDIGRRKPIMFIGAIGAFLCLMVILLIPIKSRFVLGDLLFMFGFFSSSMLLIFAMNTEGNPKWAAGVAIGFTNMLVMLGGTIFQPLIGLFLDIESKTNMVTNMSVVPSSAYQKALFILPVCQIAAFILLFFIKETFHKDDKKEYLKL